MIILDTNVLSETMKPSPEPRVIGCIRLLALTITEFDASSLRHGYGFHNGRE